MLAQLRQEHTRITEAGARAAAVHMGSPRAVGDFCRERDVPFDCFADPDRTAYRAFGLANASPARWFLNGNVVREGLKLFRRGVASGLPHPGQDIRQMPGTFVVARGGTIRIAYYARDAADGPGLNTVLGALGAR